MTTTAIEEFKARIMNSPKSRKVLDAILDAALDDEHKNQAAAWKLLVDRMLPMSYFDKDKAGGSRPSVNITITGVGSQSQSLEVTTTLSMLRITNMATVNIHSYEPRRTEV